MTIRVLDPRVDPDLEPLALAPAVPGIALAWALILVSAAAATRAVLRTRREAAAPALGRLVESAAGGRAGSIVGVVTPTAGKGSGRQRRTEAAEHHGERPRACVGRPQAPQPAGCFRHLLALTA